MIGKIRKFRKLSSKERALFMEAYYMLGMVRAAILRVSFKRLTRSLAHQAKKGELEPLTEEQKQTALEIGRAIQRAAAYTPWESACLAQSLTAQKMLQKRGIPGVFYLGAAKDKGGEEMIKAHAWSQCGDQVITGGGGHEDYAVLSVFGWKAKVP
jgi:hypothetical protein